MNAVRLLLLSGLICMAWGGEAGAQTPRSDTSSFARNGGFEAARGAAPGAAVLEGWTFTPDQAGAPAPSWRWESRAGRGGTACVTGGITAARDNGSWLQKGIAVPEGTRFLRVSVWVKSVDVRSSRGFVGITCRDAAGATLGGEMQCCPVGASRDWTRYVGSVAVPEGARTCDLRLWIGYSFVNCGTFYWDDLTVEPAAEPVQLLTVYRDETAPPAPTAAETRRGFMLFQRRGPRVVFPNSVPLADERVTSLTVAAAPGEYEPAVLIVRGLRDLKGVKVTAGPLAGKGGVLPADALEIRSVSFRTRDGQERWGLFNETVIHDVPCILEPRDTRDVAAGRNQPFWITVRVPESTAPGVYSGAVEVRIGSGTAARLPFALTVRPFRLPEPRGVMFAMYDARIDGSPAWVDGKFADLRAHGMTGIAISGDSGLAMRIEGERVVIDWTGRSPLERNLETCVRHGLLRPALWLMGGDVEKFCLSAGPLESEAFARAWRDVIGQIAAHGRERGWPEIIYQPIDEPFEKENNLALNRRLLELLKSVPGVRTEGDGMNGKWSNFTPDFYKLTDVITLHDGPALDRHRPVDMPAWLAFRKQTRADNKRLWFYNIDYSAWHPEPLRYMTGFGLWKSGADGIIEWSYMAAVKEEQPAVAYGVPLPRMFRYPEAPGEPGGPAIGYEAIREGIDDYRYLLALREAVARVRASSDAAARSLADRLWAGVQAKLDQATFDGCKGVAMQGEWTGPCEVLPDGRRIVRGDHKVPNGWRFEDYDALRGQIAAAIGQLGASISPRAE
ncbi:MAG: hypothetical protein M1457_02315 [bacterium]|nr:hypothetical protein [bacterium]